MAWQTPPVFVALQTLTDSVMNELSSRLSNLWTASATGDTSYASASDTLSRLAIGSAYSIKRTNSGATAPEWGGIVTNRQGGSATVWNTTGTNNYTPSETRVQAGSVEIDLVSENKESATVTFPAAFAQLPLIFLSFEPQASIEVDYTGDGTYSVGVRLYHSGLSTSAVTITIGFYHFNANSKTITINWLAIGPPA